jgi:hypothetical protein
MLRKLESLQGVSVLNKEAQKKIAGGTGCSFTYQDSSGAWHTEHGSCATAQYSPFGSTMHVPYCHTSSHTSPSNLSSNGGVSKCGAPYATIF